MSRAPVITPLEAHEWRLWRDLRLAALAESPDAFSPPLARYVDRPDGWWRDGAARFAASENAEMFIARPDRGLMSASVDAARVGHIGAMWVVPSARGQRLGSALLDTGLLYLTGKGCALIELSVTETNRKAQRLYASRGFTFTGAGEPLREGSPLRNLFMRLGL